MISKKEQAKQKISQNIHLFKCVICNSPMTMDDHQLTCSNNHRFDLAKQGYLNLAPQAKKSNYSKELFQARQQLCQTGFYQELIDKLVEALPSPSIRILDAGTGEGSHLYQLAEKRKFQDHTVGVDLAKEGIQVAASGYAEPIWIVSDLANLPFQNNSFDVILNILSPSNYQSFLNVLTEDGLFVKVVPGANYLKELRDQLYEGTDKEEYTNQQVVTHFKKYFHLKDRIKIETSEHVSEENFKHLVQMTPLTANHSVEQLEYRSPVTLELEVLVGERM